MDGISKKGMSGDLEDAAARGDVAYLLEGLQDPSFEVRMAAALGLGDLGGEKANLALLSVARDRWGERPEVRIAALRSLGRIHETGRYTAILDGFITGDNKKVTSAARKMLRAVDPVGFPRRLVASGSVDHGAIRVYGDSRETSALPLLREYLDARLRAGDITSSRNWGTVYAAVRAMGNIGGDDAVIALDELRKALEDAENTEMGTLARGRLEKVRDATIASISRAGKG